MFCVISRIKLGQFWQNLMHSFLKTFAQNDANVYRLIWIMSLYYLVKLEMLITRVLQLRCQIKKLQKLSHHNCGLQFRQIWIQLITACVKYRKRRCTKHASLIWSYWRCHWRTATAMMTWSSLFHSVLSRCFSSSRSAIRILYTFCWNRPTRCNQLDSNLVNFEAAVEVG